MEKKETKTKELLATSKKKIKQLTRNFDVFEHKLKFFGIADNLFEL